MVSVAALGFGDIPPKAVAEAMNLVTLPRVQFLADEVGVEVYEDHLWFPYHGRDSKKGASDE